MQINYPNAKVRRATAPFYYAPNLENSLQAMDVAPVYAPYGTDQFWPNSVVALRGSQNAVLNLPDGSIAPNSAAGNNVVSAAIAAGFAGLGAAKNPAHAKLSGAPIGPVSLVAPMPSITQSPAAIQPMPSCNTVDSWVSANPMLAALGVLGVYLFLGGKR